MTNELEKYYEKVEIEIEQAESELLSGKENIRLEIDLGLEQAKQELQELESQLQQEKKESLIEQCYNVAIDSVVGHFGLASAVLGAQDGGNVNTTHNARKGIYENDLERQRYENRGEYDSSSYHKHENYKAENKRQGELKAKGELIDYMTKDEKMGINEPANLDHVVAAKTIHDDRARVLAEIRGEDLANQTFNLKMTNESANKSKKAKSANEWIRDKNKEIKRLESKKSNEGLSDNETKKLEALKKVDDKRVKKEYDKAKKEIDKTIDKAYYTSMKPYKEAFIEGAKDAGKMAAYSAVGIVLKEFLVEVFGTLKGIFKEFSNLSWKEIFRRIKQAFFRAWDNVKARWKQIFSGSLEAGLQAFFSNIITFVVNIFATTFKSIVRIIRAAFTAIWSAVKTMCDSSTPKDERIYAGAKVFVSGMIMSLTMLGAEAIKKGIEAISGGVVTAFLNLPIPFSDETIGDALSLCISAAAGAVLSTIALHYMDKLRNKSKEDRLQMQIMTKSGEIVQYKIAQTLFMLQDGYEYVISSAKNTYESLLQTENEIKQGWKMVDDELDKTANKIAELKKIFNS